MAEIICPACGKTIEEGNAFCPYCGVSVDGKNEWAPPPVEPPHAAEGAAYTPPPAPGNPVYPMPTQGKSGTGLGWIIFLRVMLWIFFALIEIGTLASIYFMLLYSRGHAILPAVLTLLGGTLIAFLTVAGGMVALNNATNLRRIAINTAKTLELLERRK